MQILSADQIKAWDKFTIEQKQIASIDLMETAARQCVQWLLKKPWANKKHLVFCGKGNNGGDGLAIARMLSEQGIDVTVYILEFGKLGSEDFQLNLQRLHAQSLIDIHFIQDKTGFPEIDTADVVIDAMFGSGLNKPLDNFTSNLVAHINKATSTVVSIDLPSGLFIDRTSVGNPIIRATYTLTFQCYKTGLLVQENSPFLGDVQVLDIGLHKDFLTTIQTHSFFLDEKYIREIFRPRNRFSHKGSFGHALLMGGSYGKMGAVVLATKACMQAGAGLTTSLIPKCGYIIMQTTAPEAMVMVDEEETHLSHLPADMEKFSAIGFGPGSGTSQATQKLLSFVIRRYTKPLVIDADGLNCLALNKDLLHHLPAQSILTPHPKEFDRLFGKHENDFDRIEKAKQVAKEFAIVLILKSHHTLIALPDGKNYFNSTGNAGMAKGGSGDVLTGILTAFIAQGYAPKEAALLGVYIHGWAGDYAAKIHSKEAMLPSHLIECLSTVFLSLQ